ncbi:hypothetical protein JHD49_03430 [Sulfurimonas sp. SAG-AH-194-C21]|nr:hypothetical protein [Sulfurimonas sp. SAG-AH-194-C21]MDF1882981.1 hypothetical protein [Sulfurimonas sp. SAG-AH-194-C21]
MSITLVTSKKRTQLENEENNNEYLRRNGYLDSDEINNLTFDIKLSIFENTINKIKKYDSDLNIYSLTAKNIDKKNNTYTPDLQESQKRFKELYEDNYFRSIFLSKVKKDAKKYYEDIYIFFVRYSNLYRQYTANNPAMKKVLEAIKLDENNKLQKHFSTTLNEYINFHHHIKENQLIIYHVYQYSEKYHNTDTNIKRIIDTFYKLYTNISRKEIRHKSIDNTVKNPYI